MQFLKAYQDPDRAPSDPTSRFCFLQNGLIVVVKFVTHDVVTVKLWAGSDLRRMVKHWSTNLEFHPPLEVIEVAQRRAIEMLAHANQPR